MGTDWDIQRIARMALIVAVAALGIWMLRALLLAFAWGGVLAIATWPVRQWLASKKMGNVAIATLLTLVFTAVLVVPLVVLGVEAVEAARHIDAKWLVDHSKDALVTTQAWLNDLPYVGQKVSAWWQDNVTKPGAVTTLLSTLLAHFDASGVFSLTGTLGIAVASRLNILLFTIITLFFLYLYGQRVMDNSQKIATRLFGPIGGEHGRSAIEAVRGAVNGLVLVGLAEGVLLGSAYYEAGLTHAALLGLTTAVLSMIPLGAPLAYTGCAIAALYIPAQEGALQSQTAVAIELVVFGTLVVALADYLVRPKLISQRTELPTIAVLLGIFGGLSTFGLIGLFVGPAVFAVLIAMWREGVEG